MSDHIFINFVRFVNTISPKERLKYLSDGRMLRGVMVNPTLKEYNTIINHKANDTTVLTDLTHGFLKFFVNKSISDIKIIVMSGTL